MNWVFLPFVCGAAFLFIRLLTHIWFVFRLRREGVSAVGTVIGHRSEQLKRSVSLVPIVRFRDSLGSLVEGESRDSRNDDELPVGTAAHVVYDPERSARFVFTNELRLTRLYLWLLLWLVVLLFTGGNMLFNVRVRH